MIVVCGPRRRCCHATIVDATAAAANIIVIIVAVTVTVTVVLPLPLPPKFLPPQPPLLLLVDCCLCLCPPPSCCCRHRHCDRHRHCHCRRCHRRCRCCRRLMDAMVKVCLCWLLAQGWRPVTILGGTRKRGGVWARNTNCRNRKRAAPLDFEEGFGKLKEGLNSLTAIRFRWEQKTPAP